MAMTHAHSNQILIFTLYIDFCNIRTLRCRSIGVHSLAYKVLAREGRGVGRESEDLTGFCERAGCAGACGFLGRRKGREQRGHEHP